MDENKEGEDMSLIVPNKDKAINHSLTGWRRIKQIAEKAMDDGKFTIEDVRNDLEKLREDHKQ